MDWICHLSAKFCKGNVCFHCTDPLPALLTAIKAAVLIQKWYRSRRARLEISRRYSLSIFQSIEYADEQDQAQVCNAQFFLYNQLCYSQSANKMDTRLFLPTKLCPE